MSIGIREFRIKQGSKVMVKVIINADDYGIDPEATKAITDCMDKGWVTNTTLMVNMPSCEEAVRQARDNGHLDRIGLHVNIYEGVPLTERIRECREFCDESGRFNFRFMSGGFHRSFLPLKSADADALREEVVAQFERYLELGLPVKHFDAHHHCHVVPRVIPTVFGVARKYGFKSVRRPPNLDVRVKLRSKIYRPMNEAIRMMLIRPYGFSYTDYMGGIDDVRTRFDNRGFRNGDTIDLMVHPVYMKNGKNDLSGEIIDSWTRPMAETMSLLEEHPDVFVKISYKDIQ